MRMISNKYILIADSGSTKTAWCLKHEGQVVKRFDTNGINPSVLNESEIEKIFKDELLLNVSELHLISKIYFYGAGCTEERRNIIRDIFLTFGASNADIIVESDLLGAAKAVCGNNQGVVGILGTGSNSCLYNGNCIIDNTPSLGYILGDEGSGAYIGRRLISDIMKGVMSDYLYDLFTKETGLTVPEVIKKVYRDSTPNRFLASVSRFCANHLDEPEIQELLIKCFEDFFRRNIMHYNNPSGVVHLVGSVASSYKKQVEIAATRCSLKIGRVMKSPIEGLIEILP